MLKRSFKDFLKSAICILCAAGIIVGAIILGSHLTTTRRGDTSSSSQAEASPAELLPKEETTSNEVANLEQKETVSENEYKVESVVDGDTIKITYNGRLTSVRLIGINTPETVDPRKSVECFGKEASNYLKNKLSGKTVKIASDPTQSDRDKYDRLLRYIYLGDEDVNKSIISDGYGYEYTYNIPYLHQSDYKSAQLSAEKGKRGLWADNACAETTSTSNKNTSTDSSSNSNTGSSSNNSNSGSNSSKPTTTNNTTNEPGTNTTQNSKCDIKGNISSKGEKIYHVPGGRYYDKTIIDEGAGERWFCSTKEAEAAGWRASKY